MEGKISFVVPFEELARQVSEVAGEMNEKVEVAVTTGIKPILNIARRLAEAGTEVFVSRGGAVIMLRENLDVPVVPIPSTAFDLLRAVQEAKEFGADLGYLSCEPHPGELEELEQALGVRIIPYAVRDLRDEGFVAALKQARQDGVQVIIGGAIAVPLAEQYGLKGVLIQSSKDSIRQAVINAKNVALVRRREKNKARELQAIVDFSSEGIIAIDENCRIRVFNPAAEKIFGLTKEAVLGRPVRETIPNTRLHEVLRTGRTELGQLQRVGETSIVTNRIPIVVDEKTCGVVAHFQDVTKVQELEGKIRKELSHKGLVAKFTFDDIVGDSKLMCRTVQMAKSFGRTDSDYTVLITGESGTGKELFAQSMHNINRRREGPFVAVNCAAIPANLLESELFGYEDGAFTGARKGGKAGLFELAHGGTIFLDEIAEMPPDLQARLLRVLQEKEVMRVGGHRLIPINTRVIAATNREIEAAVASGEFRADLFYRLSALHLRVPPLREHLEDLPLLVAHIAQGFDALVARSLRERLSAVLPGWQSYYWPGNVRELENMVRRFAVMISDPEFQGGENGKTISYLAEIPEAFPRRGRPRKGMSNGAKDPDLLRQKVAEFETDLLNRTLVQCRGNRAEAARLLGIGRTTVWRKLRRS